MARRCNIGVVAKRMKAVDAYGIHQHKQKQRSVCIKYALMLAPRVNANIMAAWRHSVSDVSRMTALVR